MAGFDVFLRSLRDEFGEQQVGTKQEHGNCDVPKSYITDTGFMLQQGSIMRANALVVRNHFRTD